MWVGEEYLENREQHGFREREISEGNWQRGQRGGWLDNSFPPNSILTLPPSCHWSEVSCVCVYMMFNINNLAYFTEDKSL